MPLWLRRTFSFLNNGTIHRTPAKFQFMSDLHLEVGKQYSSFHFPATAPYLIIAGDIGCLADYESYLEFMKTQCKRFDQVFLVLGNHEFYGLSREEGLRRAEALEQEPSLDGRLCLMNRRRFDLRNHSDVVILGCTLQSHITPETRDMVERKLQDFKRIEGWTVDRHNAEHVKDLAWLKQEITSERKEVYESRKHLLVVTHHAPCSRECSRPCEVQSAWSSAFATDLLANGKNNPLKEVRCWIFGHTHYTTDLIKSDVRVVSNQRGYVLPAAQNGASRSVWQNAVSLITKSGGDARFTFDECKTLYV